MPLGVRAPPARDAAPGAGADPGAPVAPKLLMKAGITTIVSGVLFAALLLYLRMNA